MSSENGNWTMRGLDWDNPYRIRTWQELVNWINEIGFLSLFGMTYLVTGDFVRRKNKRGEDYGMAVSVLLPPESIWGYDKVTAAYSEKPKKSRSDGVPDI